MLSSLPVLHEGSYFQEYLYHPHTKKSHCQNQPDLLHYQAIHRPPHLLSALRNQLYQTPAQDLNLPVPSAELLSLSV